jgi:hypothetical protein
MLHPLTLKAFDLDGAVAAVELYLDAIPAKRGGSGFMRPAYAPPPLQAVTRDFAFLVPADLAAEGAPALAGTGYTSDHFRVVTTVTVGDVTQTLDSRIARIRGVGTVDVVVTGRHRTAG